MTTSNPSRAKISHEAIKGSRIRSIQSTKDVLVSLPQNPSDQFIEEAKSSARNRDKLEEHFIHNAGEIHFDDCERALSNISNDVDQLTKPY
jgi:hypothetical protein